MAVNIGTELVNNGNSGWNNLDVMNALEKTFYNMGWNLSLIHISEPTRRM